MSSVRDRLWFQVGPTAQGDVEDSAAAALQFDNGTLGTITSGYYTDEGYNSHMCVHQQSR